MVNHSLFQPAHDITEVKSIVGHKVGLREQTDTW